jgi:alcohol dehydrogenase (cytochrome c)
MSPSYSPQTSLFYVVTRDQCDDFASGPQQFHPGEIYVGSVYFKPAGEHPSGALRALDPSTGTVRWEFKYVSAPWSGALSTAGGLVFAGDMEGYLIAFDARTGEDLWHFQTGSPIISGPMSYALGRKQFIVIASGDALFAFGLSSTEGDAGGSPNDH